MSSGNLMDFARRFALLLMCLALVFLLAACGGRTAPVVRVIDTPEARELPGWQRPYEVDGIRYVPLRDHQGYRERGIASWYGKEFHGLKTSNGEIYDMYGVSAAHKTLPMGTLVKVTHLGTGRQIEIRINDRGPFAPGRIIDLSYGAARQLGTVDAGLAEVEVVAVGGSYVPPLRTLAAVNNSYAIQVAAFGVADNAHQLADRMRERFG
ncbi:MAG TPA: septal ring lytic transglycosylase RlpA family protein, partial [Pelovirga sp.]|nr:septal ring lytic transglycosylase RlpA family protein [Pelovirga sp.]